MGAFCTPSYTELPTEQRTLTGTDIPEWMTQAGQQLFQTAAQYAGQNIDGEFPLYTGERLKRYGDSKLSPAEQQAQQILMEGAGDYKPYFDKAGEIAGTLGGGYDAMTRDELLGDPYQGATREELLGTSNQELLGDPFSLETAQPYLDIYQGAQDASVRELQNQVAQQQSKARASAARGGGGFGSRLGLVEATLGAEGAMGAADLRARAAQEGLGFAAGRYDTDRGARLQAADADRASRFSAEDVMRGRYGQDRSARFDAESAGRSAFETQEASRLKQMSAYQSLAPQVQSLQASVAQGLMTVGEAQRKLDQQALDLSFGDYLDQTNKPMEMINFASSILQGTPYNTRSYTQQLGTDFRSNPSIYGQTLAGAGSLASLYKMSGN
mgnify:CR=1 FL=1